MSQKREPPPQSLWFYIECYGIAAITVTGIWAVATLAARLTSALGWTP